MSPWPCFIYSAEPISNVPLALPSNVPLSFAPEPISNVPLALP